jgi:hypothetical protein
MPIVAWLLIFAAGLTAPGEPLALEVTRQRDALELRFRLLAPLPDAFVAALPSGAQVQVVYPVRLRSRRAFLWDRRLWHGEVTSTVTFDPVIGRYRCELILDQVIVATQETEAAAAAMAWLTSPPAVRLDLPAERRTADVAVRVRAVFSSTTRWLLFPTVEGTDWVEIQVEGRP